jgi:predicted RNA-binding Zn-ribbon protein involved in translation (DUF1610 family)
MKGCKWCLRGCGKKVQYDNTVHAYKCPKCGATWEDLTLYKEEENKNKGDNV